MAMTNPVAIVKGAISLVIGLGVTIKAFLALLLQHNTREQSLKYHRLLQGPHKTRR